MEDMEDILDSFTVTFPWVDKQTFIPCVFPGAIGVVGWQISSSHR